MKIYFMKIEYTNKEYTSYMPSHTSRKGKLVYVTLLSFAHVARTFVVRCCVYSLVRKESSYRGIYAKTVLCTVWASLIGL